MVVVLQCRRSAHSLAPACLHPGNCQPDRAPSARLWHLALLARRSRCAALRWRCHVCARFCAPYNGHSVPTLCTCSQIEVDKPLGLKFNESKAPGGGLKVTVSVLGSSSGLHTCWHLAVRLHVVLPMATGSGMRRKGSSACLHDACGLKGCRCVCPAGCVGQRGKERDCQGRHHHLHQLLLRRRAVAGRQARLQQVGHQCMPLARLLRLREYHLVQLMCLGNPTSVPRTPLLVCDLGLGGTHCMHFNGPDIGTDGTDQIPDVPPVYWPIMACS